MVEVCSKTNNPKRVVLPVQLDLSTVDGQDSQITWSVEPTAKFLPESYKISEEIVIKVNRGNLNFN